MRSIFVVLGLAFLVGSCTVTASEYRGYGHYNDSWFYGSEYWHHGPSVIIRNKRRGGYWRGRGHNRRGRHGRRGRRR